MQQPELGRKIAELRKAKGFTQEELVEQCHLNVRTLQRIEAGEVIPRSYTLKAISEVLEFRFNKEPEQYLVSVVWCMVRNAGDIINLKKDAMKKVSILSSTLLIVLLGAFMINFLVDKKSESSLHKQIEMQNKNTVTWFNSGQVERLLEDYFPSACFYRNGHPSYCGKEEIRRCMQNAIDAKTFKLKSVELVSLTVDGDLAVEKSLITSQLVTGELIKTMNIQEWQFVNNKWLIVNDIDVLVKE